jgi:hypothetical protein
MSLRIELESYIAKLRTKIKAAEACLATLDDESEKPVPTIRAGQVSSNGAAESDTDYGANVKAIRETFTLLQVEFTVIDVETCLNALNIQMKREQISQALSRMRRSGELEVVEEGSGRRPSRYRNPRSTILNKPL